MVCSCTPFFIIMRNSSFTSVRRHETEVTVPRHHYSHKTFFNIMHESRRYFFCRSCCVNNTYFRMPCTCLPVQCDRGKEDNLLDRLPCFNDISSLKTLESVFKQVSLLLWTQKLKCKLMLIKFHFYWITELTRIKQSSHYTCRTHLMGQPTDQL